MPGTSLDSARLAIVALGALLAGFASGFAGFGTALVSSGLWFLALPATMVPPLITLASVVAQAAGLLTVRRAFNWSSAAPFLGGGVLGVPLGVAALATASPLLLKTSVGAFLVSYVGYQLSPRRKREIGAWGGKAADGLIGLGGGFLGGFAGLSGPLPLVWLQLRGGHSEAQRAIYQPFNLIVLALAGVGMAISGQMTSSVLWVAAYCFPATLIGAWLGSKAYFAVSVQTFQRVVLGLLFVSGLILIWQAVARISH